MSGLLKEMNNPYNKRTKQKIKLNRYEMKVIKVKPGLYCIFYEHLKQIAFHYGFNLIVHGSMDRDLDLIAIPWDDICCHSKEQIMIKEFHEYLTGQVVRNDKGEIPFSELPGGRHNYTISLNRGNKHGEWVRFEDKEYYLDISVTPIINH